MAVTAAHGFGARLRVMRVVDPPGAVDAILAIDPEGAAAARRLRAQPWNDVQQVVAELDPRAEAETVLLSGDAAEELVRASFSADLMVLGSRGYGTLRGVLLGSVSQRVVRGAACPVMVIPRTARTTVDDHASFLSGSLPA
jgi:nucleotide-binding universal stress UspA family protein